MTHEAIELQHVERVAKLARLQLTHEQKVQTAQDFERILAHVDALQQLSTQGVPPTQHAVVQPLLTRQDVVLPSLPTDQALSGAPERLGDGFGVPKIIE